MGQWQTAAGPRAAGFVHLITQLPSPLQSGVHNTLICAQSSSDVTRAATEHNGGYFAFLTFAVIAVGDWRSAKAVGQRVPERDLVGVQGQGRLRRLARIFTRGKPSSDNGRRLLGEARRRPGEEPEEPDSPLRKAVTGDQRLGGPAAVATPLLQVGQHRQRATPLQVPNSALQARYAGYACASGCGW